jgi:hypothetical protein
MVVMVLENLVVFGALLGMACPLPALDHSFEHQRVRKRLPPRIESGAGLFEIMRWTIRLCMISSENRLPLFGIMLDRSADQWLGAALSTSHRLPPWAELWVMREFNGRKRRTAQNHVRGFFGDHAWPVSSDARNADDFVSAGPLRKNKALRRREVSNPSAEVNDLA